MTNRQIKICKNIQRYKNLRVVLEKSGGIDYIEIQEILGIGRIDFSDHNMDANTKVYLTDDVVEELEIRRARVVDVWFTRAIAVSALAISVIALLKP